MIYEGAQNKYGGRRRRDKATKIYLHIRKFIRLINYPDYTIYHIDYVITVFLFTISFSCTEECHAKPALPGYLPLLTSDYNAVTYMDYEYSFRSP
jgi:hypothetical protein